MIKVVKKLILSSLLLFVVLISSTLAITEMDNGIMKVYPVLIGFSMDYTWLRGFDVKGYIITDESTNTKKEISSTYGNYGYHVFLNVNGSHGVMNGEIEDEGSGGSNLEAMHYTKVENDEKQVIDGIEMLVTTKFINSGEQLQIIYTLKNTTSSNATISLATAADVQIDGDDSATIERLDDGSGVRLWTKEGRTDQPVQFILYGKDVEGVTDVDSMWIGKWGGGSYLSHMFDDNSDTKKVEDTDSAFTFSWNNRSINAGETKTYSVLLEVGEVNVPNTGITLDDNTKFYYKDVKINGTVMDKDLKDNIIIHYIVDNTEYTLPQMATTGTDKDFVLDLTSLNLSVATPHTLKVWATDSLECESNIEERTFTVTYLKKPTLAVSKTDWTKDEVTFKISDVVNTEQYVDKYQYRLNDGNWIDCEKDVDIPVQGNGTIKIDARIVGTVENDYSEIVTAYAKIDKVNPTNTKPTATKTTSTITVNLAQTDAHSGIDTTKTMYAIKKGDSWSEWKSTNVFTELTHNTEYTVKTKITDMVGNSSESEELLVKTEELLLGNLILKLNNNQGTSYTENTLTNQNIYVAIQEQCEGAKTTYWSKENSAQIIEQTDKETIVKEDGITILLLSVTDGTNTVTSEAEHILKIDKTAVIADDTVSDEKLPQTGINSFVIILIIVCIGGAIFGYKKMFIYKDIK